MRTGLVSASTVAFAMLAVGSWARLVAVTTLSLRLGAAAWLCLVGASAAWGAGLWARLVAFGAAAGLVCLRGGTGFGWLHRLGR